MIQRLWLLAALLATMALVVAPAAAQGSDPDPDNDSCPREPEQPWHCDGIADNDQDKYPYDPSNPPPLDPNEPGDPNDPGRSQRPGPNEPEDPAEGGSPAPDSGAGSGPTGGRVAPVGGVQTGAGGTAKEGPVGSVLGLGGGSLVLAAGAGGLAFRRRSH